MKHFPKEDEHVGVPGSTERDEESDRDDSGRKGRLGGDTWNSIETTSEYTVTKPLQRGQKDDSRHELVDQARSLAVRRLVLLETVDDGAGNEPVREKG